jgi:hypothetical protein
MRRESHWQTSGEKQYWAADIRQLVDHSLPNLMRLTRSELMALADALSDQEKKRGE